MGTVADDGKTREMVAIPTRKLAWGLRHDGANL
jgi:hypothetical protein